MKIKYYFEISYGFSTLQGLHQAVRNIAPVGDGIIDVESVAATVAFLASEDG